MIGLTLALLRSHARQVLTVFLLALLAVAAAVAAPVYADMAGRAIAARDLAGAPATQRTITAVDSVRVRPASADPVDVEIYDQDRRRDFEHVAPTVLETPGFRTVLSVSVPSFVVPAEAASLGVHNGDLQFREGFCDRVVIVAGRCVAAPGEVIVTAGRTGLASGATAQVVAARFIPGSDDEPGTWVPAGEPCRLAVVGVYRPVDPTDPYWGRSTPDLNRPGTEPVLADRGTVASCDHGEETQEVVAYPSAGTLTADRVDEVRAAVRATVAQARGTISARTDIETLLTTMEDDRRTVAVVPTAAAVPLLALCWFVLYLAIAAPAQARRRELGIVKLRGVSTRDQWTIAAVESLTPVFAGAVAGYLVGHLAVWAYGRLIFGAGVTVAVTTGPWLYATVAVTGAVLAAAVARRRDLASTATDLLRRVPDRTVRWGDLTLAVLLAAGAAVAVVQLRGTDPTARPDGLALLAPALALLALALFAGAALDPIAARVGARAVHKGRLGLAVATLHIGRRRAASRLLAVLVVAVGLLTFAATAAQVGQDARERQVGTAIGATRVLAVGEVRPADLLHTVRSVDPEGAYAMAVVRVDPAPAGRPLLAVDTTRLARAAVWPDPDADLAALTAALRPAVAAPITVRGTIALTVTVTELRVVPESSSLNLRATVTPLSGAPSVAFNLGPLRTGRNSYPVDVGCADGCRLSSLGLAPSGPVDGSFRLTFNEIRQDAAILADATQLASWRVRNPGALTTRSTSDGLEIAAASNLFSYDSLRLVPPDAPVPLPVLDGSSTTPPVLDFASGDHVLASRTGPAMDLPRLGRGGLLADLEYLDRLGDLAVPSRAGEIWLAAGAPADAAQRFRAAGLTVVGERSLAAELAVAGGRPGAAGVRFLLVVAVLGLLLGAAALVVAAGVERPGRAEELRALRTQGLSRRQARVASMLGYAAVVAVAAVVGGVVAAVVWSLTGDRLPLLDSPGAAIPPWPGLPALATGAAGSAALFALALVLGAALNRSVQRSSSPDRSAS